MTIKAALRASGVFAAAVLVLVAAEIHTPSRIEHRKIDYAKHSMPDLHAAVGLYKVEKGKLPLSLREVLDSGYLVGGFPVDPWGSAYIYRLDSSAQGFALYSAGADRIDQGGEGDDVIRGEKEYSCDVYRVNCPVPTNTLVKVGALVVGLLSFLAMLGALLNAAARWAQIRRKRAAHAPK